MRTPVLAGLGLALALAAPASAARGTGPFAGTLGQGGVAQHTYDNNPAKTDCIQLAADYSVTLAYAPASDVLTLTVDGVSASGNGATLVAHKGVCTEFGITVTGTSVASTAAYTVVVTRQILPPIAVS